MNMPAFIGNIPSKGWLIIGGVTAGLIGWRLMSGSGGAQSPSNPAYDPALVALGTEAGLEKMRMSNELDTARLNADKELEMFRGQLAFEDKALTTTTSKELEMFRGELGLAETQSARDYNLSADKAGKDYSLAVNQSARDYDLAMNQGFRNLEALQINANADIETARLAADSAVKAAKASKSRGISCCGYGISF